MLFTKQLLLIVNASDPKMQKDFKTEVLKPLKHLQRMAEEEKIYEGLIAAASTTAAATTPVAATAAGPTAAAAAVAAAT